MTITLSILQLTQHSPSIFSATRMPPFLELGAEDSNQGLVRNKLYLGLALSMGAVGNWQGFPTPLLSTRPKAAPQKDCTCMAFLAMSFWERQLLTNAVQVAHQCSHNFSVITFHLCPVGLEPKVTTSTALKQQRGLVQEGFESASLIDCADS
eukprot:TRINITY_DN35256_c0_g1_i1.p1 TRINITY_DN35256_c0_g1~~TRINITY_DN35256_c0_g1_i1.p1  ORF type:complete len:152 (-),score=13.71 TRINITY_DN35256_c0_g1_i1:561-1016(-)